MEKIDIDLPSSCVQYKRFVNLANEYTHLPNIAYYILLHTAMNCIEVDQGFSTKVISHLEANKKNIPDLDQKKTGDQMEQQALALFTLSMKQDEVQPTQSTAKQYLNSSVLFDCLVVFENIDNIDKYKEMSKFAKNRAKTILSDLKTKGTSEPYKSDLAQNDASMMQASAPNVIDLAKSASNDQMQVDHIPVVQQSAPTPKVEIKSPKIAKPSLQSPVPVYEPATTNVKLTNSYIQDVKTIQKLCKHVSSALEYDDLNTSEQLLLQALDLVKRHKK